MSNLLTNPLWQPEDLGKPLPDSTHAVSVCLPRWADAIGYEEKDPRVMEALRAGYPRFVYHPICRRLFELGAEKFGQPGQQSLAFPTRGSAERFVGWMAEQGASVTTHEWAGNGW
jgi:cystathionine gamma-synthase